MPHAQLTSLELPDFGAPTTEPELGRDIYESRHKQLLTRMAAQGERAGSLISAIFGARCTVK